MMAHARAEIIGRIVLTQAALGLQDLFELKCGALHEFTDDHRSAGRDSGPAVRDPRCVGAADLDPAAVNAERFGGNLGEDGVRSLPHFRHRAQDADAAVRGSFQFDYRLEVAFTRTSESRSVHERSKTDALLSGTSGVVGGEGFEFPMITGGLQCALLQARKIQRLGNHLTGRGGIAGLQKITPAKLIRREAENARNLIHLAFECKQALRSTKSAKGAVRWSIRGDSGT